MKTLLIVLLPLLGAVSCSVNQKSLLNLYYMPRGGVEHVINLHRDIDLEMLNGKMVGIKGDFGGKIPGHKLLIRDGKLYLGKYVFDKLGVQEDFIRKNHNLVNVLGYLEAENGKYSMDLWIVAPYDF